MLSAKSPVSRSSPRNGINFADRAFEEPGKKTANLNAIDGLAGELQSRILNRQERQVRQEK